MGVMLRCSKMMLLITALGVAACADSAVQVQRVSAGTQTDFSGRWNDTDARQTSDALITDCFQSGWLTDFAAAQGRKPAIRVRGIVNKTDEHIDAQVFIKNIERSMINSNRVRVLAQAGSELESVDAEQERSLSGKQSDETAVSLGQETGADFVVSVRISSILDQVEGKRARFYKINFELISPSTGEKVWLGDHEIKKIIAQRSASW